jgi:flavin reductase (DIM6/NTAB) family NADH-FMN oxidoreductase RutF
VWGAEAFRALVADADYPMFIVTAAAGRLRAGCLVGFVTQASIDPPRLLTLVSKANRTYRLARRSSRLAVHFLHEANRDLASLFGEHTGDDVDKFAQCSWRPGPDAVPLLEGTRGWVLCDVRRRMDAGDHVAHLLDVVAGAVQRPGGQLSYQQVRDLPAGHPA